MAQTVKANFDITRINIFDSRHKMLKRNLGIYIISNFMHNTCVFKHIKTGKRRGVRQKNLLKRLLMRQTELIIDLLRGLGWVQSKVWRYCQLPSKGPFSRPSWRTNGHSWSIITPSLGAMACWCPAMQTDRQTELVAVGAKSQKFLSLDT